MLANGWLPVSMVVAVSRLGVESEGFGRQREAAAPKGSLSLLMTLRAASSGRACVCSVALERATAVRATSKEDEDED
jgi:hypothetical protein